MKLGRTRNKQHHWRTIAAQVHMGLAVAAVVLTLSSRAAEAALTYTKGQTDDGLRYVLVAGEFEFEDNLAAFSRTITSHKPDFVTFKSGGGNLIKAMELGRLIRGRRLNTLQLRVNECASACSLAFMGGVKRFAEPGSIGVHKSSYKGQTQLDTDTAISSIQHVTADIIGYMTEMDIEPALLTVALKVESNDIRYLTLSEMAQYRVITSEQPQRSQEVETQPSKELGRDLAAIPPAKDTDQPRLLPSPIPQVPTPAPPPVPPPASTEEKVLNLTGRWDYQANCGLRGRITGTFNIGRVKNSVYRGSGRNSRGSTASVQFTLTGRTINMTLD